MKKSILFICLLFVSSLLISQTQIFHENFELPSLADSVSMDSGGFAVNQWAISTTLSSQGLRSDSCTISQGDTIYLTTNAFSTIGSSVAYLDFSHICKIEFFDAAEIYVSNNNGSTWTKLTGSHYMGIGNFANIGNKFTSTSYTVDWLPAQNNAIPTNLWWKDERFDISSVAANSAQVKVRFQLTDMNNTGSAGNYGWLIDDIIVWKPAAQEASAEGLYLPFALPSGCGLGNETVELRIANNGSAVINGGLSASFKRDNGLVTTETVTNTIIPGDTITYTFTSKIDLSSVQDTNYQIKCWVTLTNDFYHVNDTVTDSVASKVALPYPVINDTTIPFGTSVTLHATHTDSIAWYSDPLAQNQLVTGANFTTPVLYDTSTYYVQAGSGGGLSSSLMPELIYYKFDVAGTSVINHALTPVGNNPATITGNLSIGGAGMYGTALQGTGGASSSNVINTGWSTSLNTGFTIAFWTKNVPSSSTLYYIWGDAGAASFRCFTNGVAGANNWMVRGGGLPDLAIPGAATMLPNMIHVVYDRTAGTYRSYIDGILKTTVSISSPVTVSGSGFTVGGQASSTGLNGLMDEFRVYSRPLTATEISQSLTQITAGSGNCPSAVKAVNVNISGMPLYNSGVTEIISPVGAVTQNSTHPVKVAIKNFAADTLKKVTIGYSVNGVVQTPFVWTGNLLYNDTTHVTIGSETLSGGVYGFKAWTSLPNDSLDGYPQNDTSTTQAYVCLSGSFTLGSPTADFPDFAALNTIMSNVGVCGHTVINILPGTYTEQFTFTPVLGVTDSSTLTFQSSTGDSTDVVIEHSATSSTTNWVVRFNGADYITFKQVTLKALNASYGRVVEMIGGASHNTLESCIIKSLGTSSNNCGVYDYTTMNHYNTYRNNVINDGYYGIYTRGASSTSLQLGTIIEGNVIDGFYYYGIYAYGHDSIIINNNIIKDGSSAPYPRGIYSYYCDKGKEIIGNSIYLTPTTYAYGMYVYYSDGTSAERGIIANNIISIIGGAIGSTNYGIYDYYSTYQDFYYNSVSINSGSASSRCLYLNSGSNQNFKNNIFSNTGIGYAFYINTPTAILSSDYNDLYVSGNNLAYWSGAKTTLTALQAASGKDANSVNMIPPFNSLSDLHLANTNLSGLGIPIPGFPTDIDGTLRSTTAPTIGAHEVPLLGLDAGVINIIAPTTNAIVNEGATVPLTVQIKNFGLDTITSMNIQYSVNNGTPVLQAYTDTLLPNATDIVSLVSFTATAGNSSVCAKTVLALDSNYFNDEYCQPFFGTPTKDAAVMRVVEIEDACNIGLDTIQIWIQNAGVDTINGYTPTTVTAHYQLDGITTIVNDTVTQQINPGDSALFTFDVLADFTVTTIDSVFDIAAWVDFTGDNVTYNDTAYDDVKSIHVPYPPQVSDTTIPYASYVLLTAISPDSVNWFIDDTTSAVLNSGLSYTTPILYDTTVYWVQAGQVNVGTGANIAPLAVASAAPACNTGACSTLNDLNFGNCGTQQMWITSAASNPGSAVNVTFVWPTPQFINKMTIHVGSSTTRFLTGGTVQIWNGSAWVNHQAFTQSVGVCFYDIVFPAVSTTRLRIIDMTVGGTQTSNVNFREIEIFDAPSAGCVSNRVPLTVNVGGIPAGDLNLVSISSPEGCGLDSLTPITIGIYNQGYDTVIGNLTASYKIDTNPYITPENIPDTILAGDTIYYTFNTPANFDASNGDTMFAITAYVALIGDPNQQNDTLMKDSIESLYTPPPPTVISPVNIQYATTATLTASSPDSLMWFENLYDTVDVGTGSTFITPILFDTTTYWVQAGSSSSAGNALYIGPQVSLYNQPMTRGYHFQSPVNITITELMVPNTTNPGPQNIQVVKLSGPPIAYPGPGTSFTTLFYANNVNTTTPISVNLPVMAGDHIMIVGARGTSALSNSYGQSLVPSNIGGTNVTLTRVVYQANLNTTQATSGTLMTEVSAAIGRVEMSYVLGIGSGCASARVPVVVQPTAPPANDAGISQIVNPVGSAASGIPHEIKFELTNFGSATLQSANIHWTLNGVPQDSLAWTGSLLNSDTAVVIIDTMIFNGGIYCIDAWTTFPNGVPDSVPPNDTSYACFNACLSGTYTIGDTTGSANFDFPSFNAAKNALIAAGVCGNVTFLVDSGSYTEQLTIPDIPGVGPNARITFMGASGDSTDVVLKYSATGSTTNWVIRFDDADYFAFKNMTIKALNNSYGRVIEMINGATHNIIESCEIQSIGTSSNNCGIYDYTTLNHYNTYLNNRITGGYYGVYVYGSGSTSWEKGTVVQGNEISGFYLYAAYFYYTDSSQIIGNYIHGNVNTYGYGLYCNYTMNAYRIIGNRINITSSSGSACYGIRDYYGNYYSYNPTATTFGLVANNFISITGGTGSHYGLYTYYTKGVEYYFNSINITGGNTSGRCLYQYNTTSNTIGQTFKNNIFTNSGPGYAAYFNTPTMVAASDYNNFYKSASSTSSYYVYWSGNKTTLAALQTASGKDLHSVNIQPPFTSATDLHLLSTSLSGLGTPIPAITYDIDGTPRSQTPTIGADEMPLIPIDAGVSNIIAPITNAIVNEGANVPVTVEVTNFGTDTIFGMNIQYSVNNGTPVTQAYADTLAPAASDNVILASFISPAGNSSICAKTVLVGDTNYFNDQYCQPFFGTPTKDAFVTRIAKIEEGCGLGLDTIMIWIRNVGADTINGPTSTTMTASYQVDSGATIVTENMNLTINPGDSALFTFSTLASFAVTALDSVFNVAAWVSLTGDNVTYNDTAYIDVESLHTPLDPIVTSPVTVPYASPASVSASSPTNDPLTWFADDTTSVILTTGPNYTTPLMYNADTVYVQAGLIFSGTGNVNIAPLAVASASPACNTGPCTTLNDLNFGNCGSQQMWITSSSSNPGSSVNVTFVWPTPKSFNKMTIHVGSSTTRFLTGGTIQIWNGSAWVNHHAFTQSIGVCQYDINFPAVTTSQVRIIDITVGGSQQSNVNFREIEIFEALVGCASNRVPLIINVSAPSSCDVGVFKIDQPVSAIYLTNSETVSVKVKNYGTNAQSNIPVSYQVDNGAVVTETITSSIPSNDSIVHTFATTANLGVVGTTYQFKTWTALGCDSVQVNDTIWSSVQNLIPSYCPSNATSTAYTDIGNVTFNVINNTSPPTYTALYTDYTNTTPAMINQGNTYPISVTLNQATTTVSSGFVEVYIDYNRNGVYDEATETAFGANYSGATSTNPVTVTGNITVPPGAASGLSQMRVVAERSASSTSAVHPCGTYSYGETEDYSVMLAPSIPNDAGVIDIIQPTTIAANATTPIEVIIVNYGTDTIYGLDVSYELNSGTPITQTLSNTIVPHDSLYYTFPAITLPTGQNQICAYTTLANDSNAFNDEKCINSYVQHTTTAPYFDDFEGPDYWLPDTLQNQWERGVPSATVINNAHSPQNVWMIDLNSTYANNSFDYLYTPKFNLTSVTADSIKFWHYYNTQSNNDGGRLQYLNVSGYWINLGSQNDPNGTNWYNTFNGVPFWSGNSNGWVESSYLLSAVTGMTNPAQFRFVFQSNASSNSYDGWAIDDFEISIPQMANDPGVTAIISPANSTQIGSTDTVKISLKNHGTNTLLTIPVHYKVNNMTTVTETWSGILSPGSTANYTFTTPYPSPSSNFTICAWATGVSPTYTFNDSVCKNINVTAAAYDVGICKIEVPVDTLYCEVKVWVKNYGMNSVSSVDVFYHLNGMNKVTQTWTGTLNPNDSVLYTFTGNSYTPVGMFNFCAGTEYTGDLNSTNDSICKSVVGNCFVGLTEIEEGGFILNQNIPNPTKATTQISYILPKAGKMRFDLINILGQTMYTEEKTVTAGVHTIELYVGDLPAGIYYYSMIFDGKRLVKKMVISK